jgi:hypothetical protein
MHHDAESIHFDASTMLHDAPNIDASLMRGLYNRCIIDAGLHNQRIIDAGARY